MRPGELVCHWIEGLDLRSYGTPDFQPLQFLYDAGVQAHSRGLDRVRPLGFGRSFESWGVEVRGSRVLEEVEVSDADVDRFVEPYRSCPLHVLEIGRAVFFLRRR